METLPPICTACTRLKLGDDLDGWRCEAFPEGIPVEITEGGFDHRKAFRGDNGIRFELDPAKADRLELYESFA